jgi:hypothetical protein
MPAWHPVLNLLTPTVTLTTSDHLQDPLAHQESHRAGTLAAAAAAAVAAADAEEAHHHREGGASSGALKRKGSARHPGVCVFCHLSVWLILSSRPKGITNGSWCRILVARHETYSPQY